MGVVSFSFFSLRRTLVDDFPFMMQRLLHHIPDEHFASQAAQAARAAGTGCMDDTAHASQKS
jgi:hypothetical protein